MDAEKYNRSVTLLCPTCGGTQFSPVSPDNIESELQKCASCSREITRDELIRENSENINEHVNEIKKEMTEDVANELKKQLASVFKGSKFIKIK
ncbi:hypothetical protein ABO04_10650 [Nitrosomonas sp. HPC101]|uniref:ECs_2282 family putative zinc-binding protein n=1 Tax=Nitrosomonas sp. HPC101 TaxID=1658667 RepID=UPI00136FEB67|nr:hypothetical protein [Nitrosomonas sp. HPC101]MXS86337.1 hypothetical protein [Nitrosomonas sp. HPC101]